LTKDFSALNYLYQLQGSLSSLYSSPMNIVEGKFSIHFVECNDHSAAFFS